MTEPRRPAEDPDRRRQSRPRPSRGASRPGSRPGSARSHRARPHGARSGPARSSAARRPPRRPGDPERRGQLTGRAAVLLLVCCALSLAMAYPAREYFAQRAEIERLRQETAAQLQRVRQLEAEKRRWEDPAYVRAQARERLHYVMPGETPYIAVGPNLRGPAEAPGAGPADGARTTTWYQRLWQSVQDAANPSTPTGAVPLAPDGRPNR
ncbi:FtsB family cell division protein [Carbonactinospora thermoautotrophica]|nr:septum formation initiator family protein [Carbonactinospora thermoautotrophica]